MYIGEERTSRAAVAMMVRRRTCTWAVTCVCVVGPGDGGSETTICGRGRSMRCVCAGQWPWAPHNGQARRSRIVRVNWGEASGEPRTWAMAPARRTELGSVRAASRRRSADGRVGLARSARKRGNASPPLRPRGRVCSRARPERQSMRGPLPRQELYMIPKRPLRQKATPRCGNRG